MVGEVLHGGDNETNEVKYEKERDNVYVASTRTSTDSLTDTLLVTRG